MLFEFEPQQFVYFDLNRNCTDKKEGIYMNQVHLNNAGVVVFSNGFVNIKERREQFVAMFFAVQASRHGMCNYIEKETGFHLNEHCILPDT